MQLNRGSVGFCCLYLLLSVAGCTPAVSEGDNSVELAKAAVQKPLPPEKAKELAGDVGENWLYGNGIGETMIAAGSIVAFPPSAIYWLGNAAMSMAGYEPLTISRALPDEERKDWNATYDSVTAGPGRLSAAVAGREFISRDLAKERLDKYMPKLTPTPQVSQEQPRE